VFEIRLLGAPEFALSGAPYRFAAPPRTLPLLAWLLLHRRAPISRDTLAYTFWPDLAEEEAKSDLRRHLYYLTKALPPAGEPWIVADKKTIGWNATSEATIDLAEFERLAANESTFEEAVAFYRGPFLEGIEDEWIEPERERLKTLAERTLLALVARFEASEPARAIGFVEQLLRVDPWREDAVRSAMSLRHRGGDRAGALREYREFAERLRKELDVEPMPETRAVFESIAHATASLATVPEARPAERETNLPERSTELFGRAQTLADISALLVTTRVATLAGTGGVGKTRLAIDVGWSALADYPDGVRFVDLAPIGDASLVVSALATGLGVAQATERTELATVVQSIRRKRLLLVVDNCEHLVAEVARTVTAIVAGAHDVRVLVTSREPLAIRGERVYRVPSLDVPPAFEIFDAERARAFGAVALFEARATASDPAFALDRTNVTDVIEIVRRLDGIALAIELAAARVTILAPRELFRRLEERFRVLTGGERTALPRQRTMHAAIEWSWDLCREEERVLFRRLAIFSGGWMLDAMESVCLEPPLSAENAIELVGALVEKSLVVATATPRGTRYRLLESLRAYGLEKLAAAGERPALGIRHARFAADFGRRVDEAYQTTPDAEWYAFATSELDNVRAALGTTLADGADVAVGAALASAFGVVWEYGSSRADRRWLDLAYERLDRSAHPELTARLLWQIAAISHADAQHAEWVAVAVRDRGDRRTRADAACWLAEAYLRSNRLDAARVALDEGAALQDAVERPKAFGFLERLRGELAARRGDAAEARERFERAIAAGTSAGATGLVASAWLRLAELAFSAGDVASARVTASDAREALRNAFGRGFAYADATANVAAFAVTEGDLDSARTLASESLELARDLDFPIRAVASIELLALVAILAGDVDRAAFLFGFTDAERARNAQPHGVVERVCHDRLIAALRNAIEPSRLAERLAPGAIAGFDRAIAEALRP
jgi:predicted ATPase/DNA-binding SARP family transcriptional activator/Tfp pilus assembly protein PilF